jgi:hypothetical protein
MLALREIVQQSVQVVLEQSLKPAENEIATRRGVHEEAEMTWNEKFG